MKKVLKAACISVFVIFIIWILNAYFGWYGYEKWKYRRDTRGNVKESIQRKVFVKKLNFIIIPNPLMAGYNTDDTLFYIEKGYTYGKTNLKDTRIMSAKETGGYTYQLLRRGIDVVYLEKDNPGIRDSITHFPILLKTVHNDTMYFKLLKRKSKDIVDPSLTDTIGVVKVY